MKLLKKLCCLILVLCGLTVSVFAFSDVTSDYDWASSSITNLSDNGYINGYPDGTFRPAQNITRAEFAKLITLMFGNGCDASYQDVSADDWFYPYISQSGGYFLSENRFYPNENVTRQEVAYAIYVALNLTDSPTDKSVSFRDMQTVDDTYLSAVKTLNREGLINGYPDGTFGPEKEITRAEIATVLDRANNYKRPEETEEIKELKANNYFFIVSRVATVVNEHGEQITKVEGYQEGELTTLLIDEDVTITKSFVAEDITLRPGDVISYYRNFFDEIRQVSIAFNIRQLPVQNRIEIVNIGNTTKRHIAVGIVKETYKEKGIELVSLVGNTEKLYDVNNSVYVYEINQNGKVELSDFLSITDSTYETGDTVIAFSYDGVLQEILVIKE